VIKLVTKVIKEINMRGERFLSGKPAIEGRKEKRGIITIISEITPWGARATPLRNLPHGGRSGREGERSRLERRRKEQKGEENLLEPVRSINRHDPVGRC